jgi:hypothetical protein
MVRTAVACFALVVALGAGRATAETYVTVPVAEPPPVVVAVPPAVAPAARPPLVVNPPPVVTPAPRVGIKTPPGEVAVGPLYSAPDVHYGCERVWRCDSVVCEWRRGCWGVYGYMESPYYTTELSRRQWESHGWPEQTRHRYRHSRKRAKDSSK